MTSTRTPPIKVLHVTEAMGGGVVTFLQSITKRQVEAGASVTVLYSTREDTPDHRDILMRFDERVRILEPIASGRQFSKIVALGRSARIHARSNDVVHLHSSFAGGVGRLLPLGGAMPVYSPHGFAFLRTNTSPLARRLVRIAEAVLGRRGCLMVTSAGEVALAKELGLSRVRHVQSGVPLASIPEALAPVRETRPRKRVTMVGRMAYQKAPWRFAAVARALSHRADFIWIGGGDLEDRERWIGDAPVDVLDWVSPDELESLLSETDVLLFPTLWEGMALSLVQAQSRGIPAVTSDVVGNRDTVVSDVSGFVCQSDADLIRATGRLLEDEALWHRMRVGAHQLARRTMIDDELGRESIDAYISWLSHRRSARRIAR